MGAMPTGDGLAADSDGFHFATVTSSPYLDTYAHLTAFHEGDLAFAHLHPHGAR